MKIHRRMLQSSEGPTLYIWTDHKKIDKFYQKYIFNHLAYEVKEIELIKLIFRFLDGQTGTSLFKFLG